MPGQSAVLIPADARVDITSQQRSGVIVRIDPLRLGLTAEIMMGERCRQAVLSQMNNPVQIDFEQHRAWLNQTFRRYFALVDSLFDEGTLLQHLEQEFSRRRLSRVCEYVLANLSQPINLTDLECVAHMSRRTLHNNFVKAFGVSPMEWVREQRLLLAYSLLSNSVDKTSVTAVMLRSGYASPSLFAAHYMRQFGERPSDTASRYQKAA